MNFHVAAFGGELSEEQKSMVARALAIREEEVKLYNELQAISHTLRIQDISLWEEMRHAKEEANRARKNQA